MTVRFETDSSLEDGEIIIKANKITEEVPDAVKIISGIEKNKIPAFKDKEIFFIGINEIEYFYTENKKVFAHTGTDKYEVRYKIYELEDMLCYASFVKIEQGVIANTDKIKNLKMMFNGTMQVTFISGSTQYASRRCVSQIRKRLGI